MKLEAKKDGKGNVVISEDSFEMVLACLDNQKFVGEQPQNGKPWGFLDGEIISMYYNPYPRIAGDTKYVPEAGKFWFIDVNCPVIKEIRKYYDRPTNWSNHLTIGRVWNTIDTITTRKVI